MTNKELSKAIREALKKEGLTAKDYRIRTRDAGYSTSVNIDVINPYVSARKIESIAHKFESVDRDQRTGEILEGGNTYIFVQYGYGVFDDVAEPYMAEAEELISEMQDPKRDHCDILRNNNKVVWYSCDRMGNITIFEDVKTEQGRSLTVGRLFYMQQAEELAIALFKWYQLGSIVF